MFTIYVIIYVTVTSQNRVPSFHIIELICGSVIYTLNNRIFDVCCVEMVKNVYRNAKTKIRFNMDFNFT